MNYIQPSLFGQDNNAQNDSKYLLIPSTLNGFNNTETSVGTSASNRQIYNFQGTLSENDYCYICPICGNTMHIHGTYKTNLRHLPFASSLTCVSFEKHRYKCSCYDHTNMQTIPFKAQHHNITIQLLSFVKDLLGLGFTNKAISEFCGLGQNTVYVTIRSANTSHF